MRKIISPTTDNMYKVPPKESPRSIKMTTKTSNTPKILTGTVQLIYNIIAHTLSKGKSYLR